MISNPLATTDAGMVSSAHPLATDAGLAILQQGGNAFDAAVAIASALNVVEPMMSGIGGYGTIMVYDAVRRESRFLNSSDRFPRSVNSDLFRAPTPDYQENRRGPKAISTPGNVRGWQALSDTYGRLPWDTLLASAITLAQEGFPVTPALARAIQREFAAFPLHAQAIYSRRHRTLRPLLAGDILIQSDLADSLAQIASHGPDTLYAGALGRRIIDALQESGGFLSLKDLELCRAEWWEPIFINYRGHQIVTAPPPATSFAALIRLGLMGEFDVSSMRHNSADALHHFAEVTKHAYWCRLKYAADPGVAEVPLEDLLSPGYWRSVVAKIDRKYAQPFRPPTDSSQYSPHTTHFVVADSTGNIVSATQTIGQLFGSRIMPPGTGIWLNNSLQYCTFEPKGNPMDAHAGRRKLSGDCPVFICRDGGLPWAALGTPGGHTIPQTVPQIVMNLIDFGMDMAGAIAQPRISFAEPGSLLVDPSLPAAVAGELMDMGHLVQEYQDGLGNAHGLTIEYDGDGKPIRFTGAADPRGEGVAGGVCANRLPTPGRNRR